MAPTGSPTRALLACGCCRCCRGCHRCCRGCRWSCRGHTPKYRQIQVLDGATRVIHRVITGLDLEQILTRNQARYREHFTRPLVNAEVVTIAPDGHTVANGGVAASVFINGAESRYWHVR